MNKTGHGKKNPIILIAGDVHGHWDVLGRHAQATKSQFGRIDGIICVGDVEAFRSKRELAGMCAPGKYRVMGNFQKVMSGKIDLLAPVWFIGGNHEPWPDLDAEGPGEWVPGVTFLGRAGVSEVLGLRVAFLSGIYSEVVSEWGKGKKRENTREMTYWLNSEVETVLEEARGKVIDLLVTHEWPAGIGTNRMGYAAGSEQITELDLMIQPKLHVCGHMHHRVSAKIGNTRVEAVGHIRSGGDGSCVVEWADGNWVVHDPLPVKGLPRKIG